MAPVVSIGMPVFNGETFLRQALDSLLRQSFSDFELIISDNASTDRTPEICLEYAERDSRVRCHRNSKNIGAIANFNQLPAMAIGEYFMFAACDDEWEPSFVEQLVLLLGQDRELGLAHAGYDWIDLEGRQIRRGKTQWMVRDRSRVRSLFSFGSANPWYYNFCLYYLWRNPFLIYGLFRRDRLQAALPIEYHLGNACDSDNLFLLRFMLLQNRVAHTEKLLFHYRERKRSRSDYLRPGGDDAMAGMSTEEIERQFRARVQALIEAHVDGGVSAKGLGFLLPALGGLRGVLGRLANLRHRLAA